MAHRVDDLPLPVVKGVGSERAYEILTESLQTLGGSGFLQDYPIEQYIRDAKIDSLYEGTTAIQAMISSSAKSSATTARRWRMWRRKSAAPSTCDASLKQQVEQLRTALEDVQAMTATLTGY